MNSLLLAINRIHRLFLNESEPEGIMEGVCRILKNMGGYEAVSILMGGEDGTPLPVKRDDYRGEPEPLAHEEANSARGCLLPGEEAARKDSNSFISLPLQKDGNLFGTLNVRSSRADPFDEKEVTLLSDLATDLGITLALIEARRKMKDLFKILEASSRRWRRTFDSVRDAIAVLDEDGVVLQCNLAMSEFSKRPFPGIIGRHICELNKNDSAPHSRCPFKTLKETRARESVIFHEDQRWIEITCDPIFDSKGGLEEVVHIVRDITEFKRSEERIRNSLAKIRKVMLGTIDVLVSIVEMKDPYTAGHQRKVAVLSRAIAERMELSRHRAEGIYMAGLIHDIGKIYVPAEILNRSGRLTDNEFELVKKHPVKGYEILKRAEFPWPISEMIVQHHERMDGSGYPCGLKGEEILLEARILAVGDTFEAMSSHRPYRPGKGRSFALGELYKNRGIAYDKDVVDCCIDLFLEKEFDFDSLSK